MKNDNIELRYTGCLIGCALGDALGYPVGAMSSEEIFSTYGKRGVTSPGIDKQSGTALISDASQMMLFTAEGIVWADRLGAKNEISSYTSYVFYAYQRWLYTQKNMLASRAYSHVLEDSAAYSSRLMKEKELFVQRGPDDTCIEALMGASDHNYGRLTNKINNSKGCAGVVRVAPAGLYFCRDSERAFRMASEFAAITHTHPTGYLAAGALGTMIAELVNGADPEEAVDMAIYILKGYDGCMETCRALEHARSLDASDVPPLEAVKRLGSGCTAEEVLSIAVYCALCHGSNVENALLLAVNSDGDSSSIGAVCGSIVGAAFGEPSLPKKWLKKLQLRDVVRAAAEDLCRCTFLCER